MSTEPLADGAPPRDWRFWCAYAVMIAPNAAVGLTLAAMPPILPELATRVGGEHNAQLIVSVAGFGMIAGGLFSGRLLEWAGSARSRCSLFLYMVCSASPAGSWPRLSPWA